MKNYNSAVHFYNKAIGKLKSDLEYLRQNNKVSEKFITIQKELIDSLEQYFQIADNSIQDLESQQVAQSLSFSNKLLQKDNHLLSLEAICMIHGIYDLNSWLNKDVNYLVEEANYYLKNKFVQIPKKQLELLQNTNDPLLNKLEGRQCNEIEQLETELAELKHKLENARKKRYPNSRQETFHFGGL